MICPSILITKFRLLCIQGRLQRSAQPWWSPRDCCDIPQPERVLSPWEDIRQASQELLRAPPIQESWWKFFSSTWFISCVSHWTKPGARWIQMVWKQVHWRLLDLFRVDRTWLFCRQQLLPWRWGVIFGDKMLGKQHGLDKPNVNCIVSPICSVYWVFYLNYIEL